jgi:hypothetical protein
MKLFQKLLNREMMKAVLVREFGGPEVIKVENNVPIPEPNDDQVLTVFTNSNFVFIF